jgi:hypothetical protein
MCGYDRAGKLLVWDQLVEQTHQQADSLSHRQSPHLGQTCWSRAMRRTLLVVLLLSQVGHCQMLTQKKTTRVPVMTVKSWVP